MIAELVEVFGERVRSFGADRGADAREFAAQQVERWSNLLVRIQTNLRSQNLNVAIKEIGEIGQFIKESSESIFQVVQNNVEFWVVQGRMPLLSTSLDSKFFEQENIHILVGALIIETESLSANYYDFFAIAHRFEALRSVPYIASSGMYASLKMSSAYHAARQFKTITQDATTTIDEIRAQSKKFQDLYTNQSSKLDSTVEDIESRGKNIIVKIQDEADKKVEARLNAREELEKIMRPVKLWSNVASRHRRNFFCGLIVILLFVLFAVFVVVDYLSPALSSLGFVKSDIAQPFTPASTFTLAAMIALIAAAGFVLKIAGRFVTNALTLAEDAEVRAALADTFIGLTSEDLKASSEDRDKARTVMLAALFRPLPGHQQEDITAPTVLSLAQDLLKKPSS